MNNLELLAGFASKILFNIQIIIRITIENNSPL